MLVMRLTDDPSSLMPTLRRRIARLLAEPGMGPLLLGNAGLDEGVAQRVLQADPAGESEAAAQAVPDEIVDQMYVIGDAARCRARIAEYRAAGVDHPLLLPRLGDLDRVCEALGPGR